MKKYLVVIALFLFACGGSDNSDPVYIPAAQEGCTKCIVWYPSGNGAIGYKLWQTEDGSHIDDCDENTTWPEGVACDSGTANCSSPVYQISTSNFLCD